MTTNFRPGRAGGTIYTGFETVGKHDRGTVTQHSPDKHPDGAATEDLPTRTDRQTGGIKFPEPSVNAVDSFTGRYVKLIGAAPFPHKNAPLVPTSGAEDQSHSFIFFFL